MKVCSLPDEKITEVIARASGSILKEFWANVTIQTLWKQNLIIVSTTDEDYALRHGFITNIQTGQFICVVTQYFKPLPGAIRGVVHGITNRYN
ncbi:hypothetical protein HPB50_015540 [Hyalomma asiaticum]|uniref:Uncharacterized protein n=1 Tax=Hyalomma asiaticum TaxID=266040 RepID=A0ACB7RWV9_HYAAI|nr:hypothetical protein HPB50_015540 [Hyalomma asiaticum]